MCGISPVVSTPPFTTPLADDAEPFTDTRDNPPKQEIVATVEGMYLRRRRLDRLPLTHAILPGCTQHSGHRFAVLRYVMLFSTIGSASIQVLPPHRLHDIAGSIRLVCAPSQ
jgi:hypothetical protein